MRNVSRDNGPEEQFPLYFDKSGEGGYCGLAEVPVIVRMKSTSDWR